MADPPWRFQNSTGKVAPEHRRLSRYGTLALDEIVGLPVPIAVRMTWLAFTFGCQTPCCLRVLTVLRAWGFTYKSNLVWHKVRKDGGPERARCWFLLSECYRADPIWGARQEREDAARRAAAK